MSRRLTPRSSLDSLKREAKRWLKALRDDVAEARTRFERALATIPANPTLRDVQHALAREYGLPGWADLKRRLAEGTTATAPATSLVDHFLEAACPDHHVRSRNSHLRAESTARRLLARHPDLAHASLATAIVCGELDTVRDALAEHPEIATAKLGTPDDARGTSGGDDFYQVLGSKGWEPLLFCCFTRLSIPAVDEHAVAIATALLDAGADPNAFFKAGDSRYTPLVGVIGEGEEDRPPHQRRDDLARLLLERGAEPYDTQVVYNVHFRGGDSMLWFLRLIHAHSLTIGRAADWDDPTWTMLGMGGYGDGARWHLEHAIKHGHTELAEWCLTHGASPNAAPARSKHMSRRSLYVTAVLAGEHAIAELLARHGADTSDAALDGIDAFTAAAMRLDRPALEAMLAAHPEYLQSTAPIFAAIHGDHVDVVRLLLDLGTSPNVVDAANEGPLHAAAYADALESARLLLARGADVNVVGKNHDNTPVGGAGYYRHEAMIDLLAPTSRDLWELVFLGRIGRVRELIAESPERAKTRSAMQTPLMWLPPNDEALAIELARLLLEHGADPAVRNEQGATAADRAERIGMFELAALLRGRADAATRPTMAVYERKARHLHEAYYHGTPEAMRAHWADTWHMREWSGMRRYVRLDLGLGEEDEEAEVTMDDARFLVAKEHGFPTWDALAAWVATLPTTARRVPDKPVAPFRRGQGRDDLHPGESVRNWDALLAQAREGGFDGVHANGQMTDDVMRDIATLEQVTSLRLEGCKALTDDGILALANMPQLRELTLGGTRLTDRGMEVLRHLPNLEWLALGGTRVSDAGAAHLAHCPRLRRVELMWTGTGDGAIAALAGHEALSDLASGQYVTDAGLARLRDIPSFRTWRGDLPAAELPTREAGPTDLMLRGTFTDAGAAALTDLHGLWSLNVDDAALGLGPRFLEPLVALPNLGALWFDAKDDSMPHIAALPGVRFLMIQDTSAGDDGFTALSRSATVETIWGRRCHNLGTRGFVALAQMPTLRSLSVSCLNVADEGVAALPTFPALRELMPMDVPDAGYRHIGRCERLEKLTLMYCRGTGDEATSHITGLPRLRSYFASYTLISDRTPELLSTIDSLEEITFDTCLGLSDAGIVKLARLPHLRRLDVGSMPKVTAAVAAAFPADVRVRHTP